MAQHGSPGNESAASSRMTLLTPDSHDSSASRSSAIRMQLATCSSLQHAACSMQHACSKHAACMQQACSMQRARAAGDACVARSTDPVHPGTPCVAWHLCASAGRALLCRHRTGTLSPICSCKSCTLWGRAQRCSYCWAAEALAWTWASACQRHQRVHQPSKQPRGPQRHTQLRVIDLSCSVFVTTGWGPHVPPTGSPVRGRARAHPMVEGAASPAASGQKAELDTPQNWQASHLSTSSPAAAADDLLLLPLPRPAAPAAPALEATLALRALEPNGPGPKSDGKQELAVEPTAEPVAVGEG